MGLWLSVRCRGEAGRQHLKRYMLEGDKKGAGVRGDGLGGALDWWVPSEEGAVAAEITDGKEEQDR